MVITYDVSDPDKFAEYSPGSVPAILASLAKHGGETVFAGPAEVVTGSTAAAAERRATNKTRICSTGPLRVFGIPVAAPHSAARAADRRLRGAVVALSSASRAQVAHGAGWGVAVSHEPGRSFPRSSSAVSSIDYGGW